MELITLRELKQQAGPVGLQAVCHAQLEQCRQKMTKTGNPFYEVGFADAEESLVLRVWNNTPMFAFCSELKERQFYEVSGEFSLGNDGRSVDGKNWTVRALNAEESAQVLAGSGELREKQEADFAFITETTAAISDPRLRALCRSFLARFGERMQRTGAARDYHHARRGGLVEHVAQMMRTAVQVCEAYPMLNRDLLVSGVLFHDVGKLWENAYSADGFTMPFTEISELIGHIPLGMEIVNKLWRDLTEDEVQAKEWSLLEPPSERVRLHLLHLIVSHHGELEFGSPVVPKTPEAQALHYIDNLDAKMEMFDRGYQVAGELAKNVQERVRPLPGRLVRPLEQFDWGEAAATSEPEAAPESEGEASSPELVRDEEERPEPF
ncbi:MAG: TraI domain-containing protein [Verrucomicrobiales bacterium]|nr:TraI domain-containing protein [Verrucomicrobiales bacterium]